MNGLLRLARTEWVVPLVFGVLFLAFAGLVSRDVVGEYADRSILGERGRHLTGTVAEVIERSRSHDALVVRVTLPDTRTLEVYLADSKELGAEEGHTIHVVVDPQNLDRNMPEDYFANGKSFRTALVETVGPLVLFAIGWFVFAILAAYCTRSEPQDSGNVQV
jgi:hypothetical protein